MKKKKILNRLDEIKTALIAGQTVWCDFKDDIPEVSKGRVVRDVRRKNGDRQVNLRVSSKTGCLVETQAPGRA
jgi:hypothetical protein